MAVPALSPRPALPSVGVSVWYDRRRHRQPGMPSAFLLGRLYPTGRWFHFPITS